MKLKVDVAQLRIGMYVAELDRPWLESPFLFQGFLIESEDDLARLRDTCRYVYVDEQRSTDAPDRESLQAVAGTGRRQAPAGRDTAAEFRGAYREAKREHEKASTRVIKLLDDARLGKSLDEAEARTVVSGLVNTISRNLNTALWFTNLQRQNTEVANHCLNTSILAIAFARYLGMEKGEIMAVGIGALLHDVGIMRIPAEILRKPGKLTREEYAEVQKHPVTGHSVMKLTRSLPETSLQVIRWHHERVDGSGYPDRLKGDEIPRAVRVAAIADVYDSMTSDRVYRNGVTPQEALAEMNRHAERDFGKELVAEFVRCVGIYPIGSLVLLSNENLGLVVASSPETRLRPVVMLVRDAEGQILRRRPLLNLAGEGTDDIRIVRVVDPRDYGIDIAELIEETEL